MTSLRLHPDAEAEVEEAADFYEGRRPGLGEEFRAEIEEAVARVRATPTAFAPYKRTGCRRFLVDRFGYGVYFTDVDGVLWVVAVANQRRRPDYWLGRLADL